MKVSKSCYPWACAMHSLCILKSRVPNGLVPILTNLQYKGSFSFETTVIWIVNYNVVIIFYSNPSSAHNTQRRKTVTFLETIECPAGHHLTENISGKQSGTNNIPNNHGHQGSCNSEVDDFPLPPPPLPIHQNSDRNSSIQNNSDATTNSDSSSVLTSPCSTRNDASNYVESRV